VGNTVTVFGGWIKEGNAKASEGARERNDMTGVSFMVVERKERG
jgi:hypothetical protein